MRLEPGVPESATGVPGSAAAFLSSRLWQSPPEQAGRDDSWPRTYPYGKSSLPCGSKLAVFSLLPLSEARTNDTSQEDGTPSEAFVELQGSVHPSFGLRSKD